MITSTATAIQSNVLALNRQFMAVQVISARRAFCLLYKELAEVIALEEGVYQSFNLNHWIENCELRTELGTCDDHSDWVQTVRFDIQVPRVIRLLAYEKMPKNTIKFNRRNIFLRDEMRCQYCGSRYSTHKLSLDHVHPKSRGGPTTWENIVCCCLECNVRKGGRTPSEAGMRLLQAPRKPARNPLLFQHLNSRKYESWRAFLPE